MRKFRLGALIAWTTKKGIPESRVHFQVRKGKATLTADEFRELYEWFEEEDTRLVRKALIRAKKQAPVFALGEICAINGEQLDVDTFGNKEIYVNVASLRPLRIEDPTGKIWSVGLGFRLRKLTVEEEDKLGKRYR
jgi:hypothetical protein